MFFININIVLIKLQSIHSGEVTLMLITKRAIPATYVHEEVDLGDQGIGKLVVIHGVPVLQVPPGSKVWCSGQVTIAWAQLFQPRVPQGTTLCNYDHAPGRLIYCIKKQYFE